MVQRLFTVIKYYIMPARSFCIMKKILINIRSGASFPHKLRMDQLNLSSCDSL